MVFRGNSQDIRETEANNKIIEEKYNFNYISYRVFHIQNKVINIE
jgi:hypothetical protein